MWALIDEESLLIFTAILSTKYLNWREQNNEGLLQAAAMKLSLIFCVNPFIISSRLRWIFLLGRWRTLLAILSLGAASQKSVAMAKGFFQNKRR